MRNMVYITTFSCPPVILTATSLLRLKNLNLHCHFGKNCRLFISAKLFHPKSSVSRHAGSTNWNVKRTMIIEPDSDLQRFWARDTEDLGALEVFYFISFHFTCYILNIINSLENRPRWIHSDESSMSLSPPSNLIYFFTHLKLCFATATHNFKWVKISHICLIWDQKFLNLDV